MSWLNCPSVATHNRSANAPVVPKAWKKKIKIRSKSCMRVEMCLHLSSKSLPNKNRSYPGPWLHLSFYNFASSSSHRNFSVSYCWYTPGHWFCRDRLFSQMLLLPSNPTVSTWILSAYSGRNLHQPAVRQTINIWCCTQIAVSIIILYFMNYSYNQFYESIRSKHFIRFFFF